MVQITLTEALAMAEPGDVLRVDFDGLDPSFMVRTLKGWYDATASQRVDKSETWEGYDCTQLTKPNGVVYSIRGQADAPILETPSTSPNCGGASGQPAADSQDAPSVADVSLRREVWQLAEQLRTLQARVDYLEGEDGLHTVADSKALAAIRTLQQDVAALKQQGGELREGEPCLQYFDGGDGAIPGWLWATYIAALDVRNGGDTHYLPQPAAPGVSNG